MLFSFRQAEHPYFQISAYQNLIFHDLALFYPDFCTVLDDSCDICFTVRDIQIFFQRDLIHCLTSLTAHPNFLFDDFHKKLLSHHLKSMYAKGVPLITLYGSNVTS